MIDPLDMIYPDVRVRLKRVYASMLENHGVQMRCCQGGRSWTYQNLLFSEGRTIPGERVTNAQGGESSHNFYLAGDSCFSGSDPFLEHNSKSDVLWNEYGKLVVAFGLTWGGNFHTFPDRPHAEHTYGLKLSELREIYAHGKLEGVWTKLDQIRKVSCEWENIRSVIKTL